VIPIDQPADRFATTLRHELTHVFEFSIFYGASLRRTIRSSPPLWIMEGLASYLGNDESTSTAWSSATPSSTTTSRRCS
jgi:hypothetical protein